MKIENVIIPLDCDDTVYDVECSAGQITSSKPRDLNDNSSQPALLLPTLCHPHIHLDKAYLLTLNSIRKSRSDDGSPGSNTRALPDYSDLVPETGTFQEALSLTSKAKSRFTLPDLLLRGSQLIAESITYGVTSMRAFVEIDHVTQFKCIEAAMQLKERFAPRCHVQICAFAQDPVMSGDHGAENRKLMENALVRYANHVDVLGTTPYVETNEEKGLDNVKWAIELVLKHNLHLDFHLDYNLNENQNAMVFDVVDLLTKSEWVTRSQGKRIMLGHCTRMTLLDTNDLTRLKTAIGNLPLSFVGLPTSDLFMMGRPDENDPHPSNRQRGTLQILHMIHEHGFDACIGINNVGNAFTPWGSLDPLSLASLGVGLYQGGTEKDAATLYRCVSTTARKAIGLHDSNDADGDGDALRREKDDSGSEYDTRGSHQAAGMLLVQNEVDFAIDGVEDRIDCRQRLSIKDVVWDPPERRLRHIVGLP